MTKLNFLSAALVAAAMLAAPAMAATRHVVKEASTTTQDGRACIPAPRVGAFATAPWTGDNVPCEPASN
jgi:hypothetical protein